MSNINKLVYGVIQQPYQYPFDGDSKGIDKYQTIEHFTDGVIPNENPNLKFGEEASTSLQKLIQKSIKKSIKNKD